MTLRIWLIKIYISCQIPFAFTYMHVTIYFCVIEYISLRLKWVFLTNNVQTKTKKEQIIVYINITFTIDSLK